MRWPRARHGPGYMSNEMHHGVAIADIDIELIKRAAPEVVKILLHLHFDIVPREIFAQPIAIVAKLIGNGRDKKILTAMTPRPRSAPFLFDRQHQMLIGRAWPHHIGFCGIGFGIPQIGRKHALGLCPHDHHKRACLDPIVGRGLFCGVGIGVASAIVAPDPYELFPSKGKPNGKAHQGYGAPHRQHAAHGALL